MRTVVTTGDVSGIDDPASAFDAIVTGSHTVAARVDVLFDREVIAEGLPVESGSVTFDRTAGVEGRLNSLTIPDPTRIPTGADDELTPFGYEARVWRGVAVNGGAGQLLAALGTFPIQRSSTDAITLASTLAGEDRSRLVKDARFEDAYTIAAGTNYATAIEDLISAGVSGLAYNFPSTTFTTPALAFGRDDDRWEVAQRMARTLGNEIYFDGLGVCTMRPEPSFATEPDLVIGEGAAGTLINTAVALDRGPAYNRVVAYSSNAGTGQVFTGTATDNDPQSPTYYFGPFGKKPRFYASPFIASTAQAESAAQAILDSNLGVASAVSFAAVPNPRLETSDAVQVVSSALGIDTLYLVDSLTVGVGPQDAMTGALRSNPAG